jgi:hypothetical protein
VAHWWGVDPQTVTKWLKVLGVGIATEETSRLHQETIEETGEAMRALGVLKARDPKRCRKLTEARRGKASLTSAAMAAHLDLYLTSLLMGSRLSCRRAVWRWPYNSARWDRKERTSVHRGHTFRHRVSAFSFAQPRSSGDSPNERAGTKALPPTTA